MKFRNFLQRRVTAIALILYVLLLVFITAGSAIAGETGYGDLKNRVGVAPPFPGVVVVEYERFILPLSQGNSLSVGMDAGFVYDKVDQFYEDDVNFESNIYVLNPFIRYYFGSQSWFVRPALMVKPSIVIVDPGKDMKGMAVFPAYELHALASFSYKRFFCTAGIGYKQFLRTEDIEEDSVKTSFPGDTLLLAIDVIFGISF